MNNFLIIGAGQLGSRHLQGILKLSGKNNVYVVDPSENAIDIAKERANEINHSHNVIFEHDLKNIPSNIFIAIVATNSNIRLNVSKSLVENHTVKYLILEKVLFQDEEAYFEFQNVLSSSSTMCWVNHPRRMFDHYKKIKQQIVNQNNLHYSVYGSDWGLACNALHFIDLFNYLSNSNIKAIDTSDLEPKIHDSKRNGFIEFYGTLRGSLLNGNTFSIHCPKTEFSDISVVITQPEQRIWIQEGKGSFIVKTHKEENYIPSTTFFSVQFQSSLTTQICEQLIKNSECDLPTFEIAKENHLIFIRELLLFYNSFQKEGFKKLPIT